MEKYCQRASGVTMHVFKEQYEIAMGAFRKFLVGEIEQPDGTEQTIFKGRWELKSFPDAVAFLSENTGKGKPIDPFQGVDSTAWIIFANMLMQPQIDFKYNALDVLRLYLDTCYELQNKYAQWLHKGAILYWISEHHYNLGQAGLASQYMIYAFIDDIFYDKDPFSKGAYRELKKKCSVSDGYLEELVDYVKTTFVNTPPLFPEEVMVGFDLNKARKITKIT